MERWGPGRAGRGSVLIDHGSLPVSFDDGAPGADDSGPDHAPVGVADHRPGSGRVAMAPWVRYVGWGLLGLQLVAMLVFSSVQYSRFGLTNDFANYSQAWWAIAHGHLDPYSAGLGVPFWKNDAEFALWPLALLSFLDPHPITLLWVQDIAVVVTEVVTFAWIMEVVDARPQRVAPPLRRGLALGAVVVLVVNPLVYETIAFDFHFEAITALFVVLTARALWSGRFRWLWLWVALTLLSSAVGGFYLVGVGISGLLAGPRWRRPGALTALVGLAWFVIMAAIGGVGVGGKTFSGVYGYLAGAHHGPVGIGGVVIGALGHPGLVAHAVVSHWSGVAAFVIVVGAIGVVSPWGLGMSVVVLGPILVSSGIFIGYGASFQSWPVMPFVLVGSVMVLLQLFEHGEVVRRVAAVIVALWAALLAAFAVVALPSIPRNWLFVKPTAAAALARIEPQIPPGAEVVVSLAVMGRFAQRQSVYGFERSGQTFPVRQRLVVFVLGPHESFDHVLPQSAITAASVYLRTTLHARPVSSGGNVSAFFWSPPKGTTTVTLP